MGILVQFIIDNAAAVIGFFGVILGGLLTYFSTMRLEGKREKRQFQRQRMSEILIPYCGVIDSTLESIPQYFNDKEDVFGWEHLKKILKGPAAYLKADKRVYLSKKDRDMLRKYSFAVDELFSTLNEENKQYSEDYCNWLGKQLFNVDPSKGMEVNILLSEYDYRDDILRLITTSAKEFISSIECIYNNDPEQYSSQTIEINRSAWDNLEMIDKGVIELSDLSFDEQESCKMAERLSQVDDKQKIEELLRSTRSNKSLKEIEYKLKDIQNELIKEIDKIAG